MNASGSLSEYRFIHFATHGILPGEIRGLSEPCLALSLYGDPANDGFLKMSEIFGLRLDADQVVLSACQTGIEEPGAQGQGISGLGRAFFYAGTPRLLVSLWSISDQGTMEFMKEFYSGLEGRPGARTTLDALDAARKKMLAGPFASPFYWAPFVLLGEWR